MFSIFTYICIQVISSYIIHIVVMREGGVPIRFLNLVKMLLQLFKPEDALATLQAGDLAPEDALATLQVFTGWSRSS